MTPNLDLSDFLVPLIFIGVAIYQVLTRARRKPDEEGPGPSPFPDDFDPGASDDARSEPQTWDELMEALGQKPEPRREPAAAPPPEPTPPPPVVVALPPPLPRRIELPSLSPAQTSDTPVRTPPQSESGSGFWGSASDPSAYSRTPQARTDGSARAFAAQAVRFREIPAFDAVHLRQALRQPDRIREAILLNEILQKPVALRGSGTGWSG